MFSAVVKIALDIAVRQALMGDFGPPKVGLLAGYTRALVVRRPIQITWFFFLAF